MSSIPYPNPQSIFYQQYESVRRDEIVGILLALFLGTFGIHHFYLRRTGLGILYLCFFWTGIPSLLGFIECFFMPARVREFNALQATTIAAALGVPMPNWSQSTSFAAQPETLTTCQRCGGTNASPARFCSACGGALT